jgi:hypothetical protein
MFFALNHCQVIKGHTYVHTGFSVSIQHAHRRATKNVMALSKTVLIGRPVTGDPPITTGGCGDAESSES